jgi:hypothetical protein
MDKKQKYIKIALSDFSQRPSWRSKESYFRSMEKYLEINNQSYESDGQTCIIYVNDKNDAVRIGLHFGLNQFKYFDGLDLLPLILDAKEKSPSNVILDNTGKRVSIKKLRERSIEEIKLNCIQKSEVIKRMILTKREIEKAFAKGELSPINFMNKCFINRKELSRFIKR